MIEGHGDDIYNHRQDIKSNFSTNIFCKRNKGLENHLKSCLHTIYNYPSPDASQLKNVIAYKENVCDKSIVVTSGAVEAIYLIASAFSGHSSILSPSFSEYEDACKMYGHKISHFSELVDINPKANLVWICNPNNPTGKIFTCHELGKILNRDQQRLVIIDQAYEDYTFEKMFDSDSVLKYPNLVILKSLTKKFSLPGMRIGYLVAHPDISEKIRRRMMPWSVNSLAIEAALYCFNHESEFKVDTSTLINERCRIAERLQEHGITTFDSKTNFMLCRLPWGTANSLKKHLIEKHGILIRDASNFHSLNKQYFRVAAQANEENDNLIKGIESWLKQYQK